VLLGADRQAS